VGHPPIRAENLTKRYGSVTALHDLNLEMTEGEVLGYLGPNGAGKTTTIRLLLGLIRPTAGRAALFGLDCWKQPVEAHRRVAYVAGEANLWPSLTGEATLDLLSRVHGQEDTKYRKVLIDRFAFDPTKKVRTYSKGNRQKVLLIAGLMSRADLLLLDEPTSGLDPLMEQQFRVCIDEARERGQTVFLSSHILSEVEALCDRVAILRSGSLVEMGSLAEMRHFAALTVEVTFDGPVPDVSGIPGVKVSETVGNVLRCQVTGSVDPLLSALAGHGARHILSREPSLEELFLAHYGPQAGGATAAGDATAAGGASAAGGDGPVEAQPAASTGAGDAGDGVAAGATVATHQAADGDS
jgi:ABC-2 type transport system ATP-binding protein